MNKIVGGSAEDYHRKQQEERQKKRASSGVGGLVQFYAQTTGNFFIDDELLAQHGVSDLERYSMTPGTKNFIPDFFVD